MRLQRDADAVVIMSIAGSGKRFADAGYKKRKPFIDVCGVPMFARVLANVLSLFPSAYRVHAHLIIRPEDLDEVCATLHTPLNAFPGFENQPAVYWGPDSVSVNLEHKKPAGFAAALALHRDILISMVHGAGGANRIPVVVANCDQLVVSHGREGEKIAKQAGYFLLTKGACAKDGVGRVLTFKANDSKWSYVKLAHPEESRVIELVEKQVVSSDAVVGIYGFNSIEALTHICVEEVLQDVRINNEFYLSPALNKLRFKHHFPIEPHMSMVGLGTPQDYEVFLNNNTAQSLRTLFEYDVLHGRKGRDEVCATTPPPIRLFAPSLSGQY